MSGPAAGVLGLMAGLFARTTVVLALALIAAMAARRRPAAFRHVLLSSALIGLLVLPVLTLAPVGWRSSLLPGWMTAPAFRAPGPARAPKPAGAANEMRLAGLTAAPIPGPSTNGTATEGTVKTVLSIETRPASPPLPGAASVRSTERADGGAGGQAPRTRTFPVGAALMGLWLAGFLALLSRLAVGLAGAARLTNEAIPLDQPAWRVLLERFLALVSLRRPVRLRSHPEVFMPLTWGWRNPVVLLPEGADEWSDDERSSALCHELSHIKRADFVVMLLVRTSLAVFWWNPLCWVAYRELLKEQEIACDELVLRAGIRPSTYAATLLAFRRSAGFRWDPSAALLGLLGRSSFQERLAAILRQKLTFMEVKMKTKILLALALVLAVAVIGTARPAVGREVPKTSTTLAESALPSAGPLQPVLEAQAVAQTVAEPVVVQEKEKEKAQAEAKAKEAEKAAKEKKVVEKTVVIKPVVVEDQPLEIIITQGDEVKKITLDKPVTITKGKDGETIVLTVEGKDVQVLRGEPLRLEIKGGELLVLKEGKPLKIEDAEGLELAKEYSFTVAGKPGAEAQTYTIVKRGDAGKGEAKVVVGTTIEGEPATAWTVQESDKAGHVWVAKSVSGEPLQMTWVAKDVQGHAFSSVSDQEMLEKVRALQEQVEAIKAKKMDISALEQSLKKLETELQANEEKLKELELKTKDAAGAYALTYKAVHGEPVGETAAPDQTKVIVKTPGKGEGMVTLIFTGRKGEEGKKAYETILARLKKELPEGSKVAGQGFDPETGAMTFGITLPEGKKVSEDQIKKLVETIHSEIKK